MVLKEKSNSRNLNSFAYHQRRKKINPIFYLCINVSENKVLFRNRAYFTNIGFLVSSNLSDDSASFEYFVKSGKTFEINITSGENDKINLLILETKKNGKVKTYFSPNCGVDFFSI